MDYINWRANPRQQERRRRWRRCCNWSKWMHLWLLSLSSSSSLFIQVILWQISVAHGRNDTVENRYSDACGASGWPIVWMCVFVWRIQNGVDGDGSADTSFTCTHTDGHMSFHVQIMCLCISLCHCLSIVHCLLFDLRHTFAAMIIITILSRDAKGH